MKKILLLALCAMLLFTCAPVSAQAAEPVSFSLESVAIPIDRLTEVRCFAQGNTRLCAALFRFTYDKTVLELYDVKAADGSRVIYTTYDDCFRVSYLCADGADVSASAVFTLCFKTLREGSTEIGFSVEECVDENAAWMAVGSCTGGTVTVTPKAAAVSSSGQSGARSSAQRSAAQTQTKPKAAKSISPSQNTSSTYNRGDNGESTDAAEDLGAVNRVVEKDYDRMTPLIILTVSVTAAGAFIGFLAFTVVNRLKAKKKSNSSPGE